MRSEFAIDWIKRLKNSQVIKYSNDAELALIWDNDKFIKFEDPMPSELFDNIMGDISNNSVMLTQSGNRLQIASKEEFETDLNSSPFEFNCMAISGATNEVENIMSTSDYISHLTKNLSQLIGRMVDKLSISGDGLGRLLGLVPPKAEDNNPSDFIDSVRSLVTFVEKTDPILTLKDLLDIQAKYLEILKLDPNSDEGKAAIAKAKWYANSRTGIEIADIKKDDGSHLIDPNSQAMKSVGIPDAFLGSVIVYNEEMNNIDNRPRTTWQVLESNLTPLIYGNLDGLYDIKIYKDIHAKHMMLKSNEAGVESELLYGIMIKGTVNKDKALDGKLPYVALEMKLEPRTDEELDEGDKAAERVQQYYEIVHGIDIDMTSPNEDWIAKAERMSSLEGFPAKQTY
jgi:hypothetical protein